MQAANFAEKRSLSRRVPVSLAENGRQGTSLYIRSALSMNSSGVGLWLPFAE